MDTYNAVAQLVRETPGIDREAQEVLLAAIEKGIIPERFPPYPEMMNQILAKPGVTKIPFKDLQGEMDTGSSVMDKADVEGEYLRTVLLPIARREVQGADSYLFKVDGPEGEETMGTVTVYPYPYDTKYKAPPGSGFFLEDVDGLFKFFQSKRGRTIAGADVHFMNILSDYMSDSSMERVMELGEYYSIEVYVKDLGSME